MSVSPTISAACPRKVTAALRWFETSASCRLGGRRVLELENDRLCVLGVPDPAFDLGRDTRRERHRLSFVFVKRIEQEFGVFARFEERHRFAQVGVGASFKNEAPVDEREGRAAQIQRFLRDDFLPVVIRPHVDSEHGAFRFPGNV